MPASEPQLGLLTTDTGALLVDQVRLAGLPYLMLDAERTGVGPEDCAGVVARLRGTGTQVVVRVPDASPDCVATYANTEADELVLPQIRRVDEVAAALDAVRYPPHGSRSRQPSRANSYGRSWTEPRLSVLAETAEACDCATAIATLDGVAGIWIGTSDLRDDLARRRPGAELGSVIDRLIERCASTGVGMPVASPEAAADAFSKGVTRCVVYWDVYLRTILDRFAGADGP